jgi:hypothetical protein
MGVLIKGTIQVQDAESVIGQNTGVIVGNSNYIDSYEMQYIAGTDEANLATNVTNAIADKLTTGAYSLFAVNVNIQGITHSCFLTWIKVKNTWV